jgi:hypothetical protein
LRQRFETDALAQLVRVGQTPLAMLANLV